MSIQTSTNIQTSGLIFNFDSFNPRSYLGPPMQNVASTISASYNDTSASFYMVPGYERVDIPTVGEVSSLYMDMYNDYPAVSGSCCPAPINFGYSLVVSPSTLYTYAILYKSANRYTHPNYMYRYEYTSGSSYVTEAGIHSTSNEVHLGNNWYWAWGTFTTSATTGLVSPRTFMYQYTTYNRLYIAKVLLTQGNYTALHPKKWPDPGTTRSNTQALLDIKKNTTITANSLTYNNDGSFSYNYTSGYLTTSGLDSYNWGSNITVEAWLYHLGGTGVYRGVVTNGTVADRLGGFDLRFGREDYFGGENNGTRLNWFITNTSGTQVNVPTYVPSNQWKCVTATYDGTTSKTYVDGILFNSAPQTGNIKYSGYNSPTIGLSPGTAEYLDGNLSVLKIYNRALSATEILNNFNAHKSRYGL